MVFHRLKWSFSPGRSGFTLLEMMIVLVLMSLITGLVLPRLDKVYSGVFASFSASEVLRSIAGLGYTAMSGGNSFILTDIHIGEEQDNSSITTDNTAPESVDPNAPVLPEGWKLTVKEPIHYRANGVCLGGIIRLFHGGNEYRYRLRAPYCVPEKVVPEGEGDG